MKKYKVIFCQGGLGDHLALSTLPEEWSKKGYDVYLSYSNVHRNLEIYDLVWKCNPFIKGFIDGITSPFNESIQDYDPNDENHLINMSFIQKIEADSGIFDTGNQIPKVYITTNKIPELENKTIVNFESISSKYEAQDVLEKLKRIIQENNIDQSDILELYVDKNINEFAHNFMELKDVSKIETNFPKYTINNIYQHADVINSCKNYITVLSGGASLAAALNKKETWVIMNENLRELYRINRFIYPNQTYVF